MQGISAGEGIAGVMEVPLTELLPMPIGFHAPPSAPVYARAPDATLPAPKSWLMVTSELQPNAAVQYKAVIA